MATKEPGRRRMNRRGQVTLPASLRKETGLVPGTEIEFVELADGLLVRRARNARPQPDAVREQDSASKAE